MNAEEKTTEAQTSGWALVPADDLEALVAAGLLEAELDAEGVTVDGATRGKTTRTTYRLTQKGRSYYKQLKGLP